MSLLGTLKKFTPSTDRLSPQDSAIDILQKIYDNDPEVIKALNETDWSIGKPLEERLRDLHPFQGEFPLVSFGQKEFLDYGDKLTPEQSAAHTLRGYSGFGDRPGPIPNHKMIDEIAELNRLKEDSYNPVTDYDPLVTQRKIDLMGKAADFSDSVDTSWVRRQINDASTEIDKPLYVTRREGLWSGGGHSPNDDVSARVVEPMDVNDYDPYSRSYSTYGNSDIYRLDPGATVMNPKGTADRHEVVVPQRELDYAAEQGNASSVNDYIANLLKGKAKFGVGGLGVYGLSGLSPQQAEASQTQGEPTSLDEIIAKGAGTRKYLGSALESIASIGSNMVAEPYAGLAGIAGTLLPGPEGQGANWIKKVQDTAYKPRDPEALKDIGELLKYPVDKYNQFTDFLGDNTQEATGNATLATMAKVSPDILGTIFGMKALMKAAKSSRIPTEDAYNY